MSRPAGDPMARLDAALDALRRPVDLWWRDDDAVAAGPRLDRLLALAGRHAVPLVLAVVPSGAEPGLAAALGPHPRVAVFQHGWSHADRAGPGRKKAELTEAALADGLGDLLQAGSRRLAHLFGARYRPVMTPPWNRVDAAVAARLGGWGYRAVSLMAGNPAPGAPPRLDCHVDPVDWRGGGGFIGVREAVDRIASALESRGVAPAAPGPVGLLTHHRIHDAPLWEFLNEMLERLALHPMIRWPEIDRLLDGAVR